MKMILEDYIQAAVNYGLSTLEGDSKDTNKNYKLLDEIFRNFKNENCLDKLEPLIYHENDYVKLWSATHTLILNESNSKKVLMDLAADDSSLVGFDAEITVQEWDKGNLSYLVE